MHTCSLRAPRMGTRDRAADPYATDAREFLRKRLIGREVTVKMEYNRKVAPAGVCVSQQVLWKQQCVCFLRSASRGKKYCPQCLQLKRDRV
eukprot:scaffold231684_cov21-Tisochrysis_lutea.AAC.1